MSDIRVPSLIPGSQGTVLYQAHALPEYCTACAGVCAIPLGHRAKSGLPPTRGWVQSLKNLQWSLGAQAYGASEVRIINCPGWAEDYSGAVGS